MDAAVVVVFDGRFDLALEISGQELVFQQDALLQHQLGNAVIARRPSSTILILPSAEKCRRVRRRISFATTSAEAFRSEFLKEGLGFISVPLSPRRDPNPP